MAQLRFTTKDLEAFPVPLDDTRYEIIDGKLYVSTQPSWEHQITCDDVCFALRLWDPSGSIGTVVEAPGVIFADDDNVAPDVVWVSAARISSLLGPDRHLHAAPDLVIEVLSPGPANESRDRDAKLKLYSRRGVLEYWIVDWQLRQVAVYRRSDAALRLVATLLEDDRLESPLLPGFSCPLHDLFARLPTT